MSLSKSQLSSWTPEAWSRTGHSLKTFADGLEGGGDDYNTAINDAGDHWEGKGFDDARERGRADIGDIDEVAGRIKKAGDALITAGDSVKSSKDQIFFVVDDLVRTLYSVADDWTVTDIYPYSSPEERAALEPTRIKWANKNTRELKQAAGLVKDKDEEYAPKITEALADLSGLVPVHEAEGVNVENASDTTDKDDREPLSAEQGREDAQAIIDGTASDEVKERFREAAELTQEQLDSLANGDDVALRGGQFEYLRTALNTIDEKGGLDAFESFGGDDTGVKESLANAIHIVANPQIDNGLKDIPPELLRAEGIQVQHGGIQQLPQSIREPLLSQPGKVVGDDSYLTAYEQLPEKGTVHLPTFTQLEQLRGVMSHAKDSGIQGSDVNRLYLERTSEIAGIVHNHGGPFVIDQQEVPDYSDYNLGSTVTRDITLSKEEVTDQLNGFLDVTAKDQVAFHDFLADGNADAPSDVRPISYMPGESFDTTSSWDSQLGQDYSMDTVDRDGSDRLKDLLTLDWNEENGGDSGLRTLMSDMGDTSIVYEPGETPAPGATVLGENAQMVADHLGKEGSGYLNMDDSRESLGGRNPGVTEAMADGLGPHLIGLAGGERAEGGTWGTSGMDGLDDMTDMFAVLDTTEESATTINSWGANANHVLTSVYAASAEPGANGQINDGGLGELSGRISTSMADGLTLAANDLTHDERADEANAYYERSLNYDIARTATKEALGFIPGVGSYIKPVADITGVALKGEIIGPADYLGDHTSERQEILERANKPLVESVQDDSTSTLVALINNTPDLEVLTKESVEKTDLAAYLNEDGTVDTSKIGEDDRQFRAAAFQALGELDDQWRNNINASVDNADWGGATIRPDDKPDNPALDN